jgi:hypothetical protein
LSHLVKIVSIVLSVLPSGSDCSSLWWTRLDIRTSLVNGQQIRARCQGPPSSFVSRRKRVCCSCTCPSSSWAWRH